jgi:hypothetical protein
MTRHELMCRMSGREFMAWLALEKIHADEQEHARNVAESGDGVVVYHGRPEDDDDEDDDDGPEDEDVTDGTIE